MSIKQRLKDWNEQRLINRGIKRISKEANKGYKKPKPQDETQRAANAAVKMVVSNTVETLVPHLEGMIGRQLTIALDRYVERAMKMERGLRLQDLAKTKKTKPN